MALPAQLQKQTEAVNKLYEDLNKEAAEPTENGGAQEETYADDYADTDGERAPAPRATEPPKGDETEETFERKYKTLQGMYNAEVPRLHADKRELTNRVQQLEQLFASMSAKPAASAAPVQKHVTEQDVEDYGDSIEVMRKVFREEMSSKDTEIGELRQLVRQMQGTVVPQVHQLSHNYAVSNEQRFWAELQAVVPDWQEINGDKEFQSWLLEVDPLTGLARQTYLDDAQRNLDVRRVTNFFTAWKGNTGGPSARTDRKAQSASELERQISPGKGRAGASRSQGEPKTYTPEDIRSFFADVQKGRYRGKEAERDRIERDIFAAQRQGRIVTA